MIGDGGGRVLESTLVMAGDAVDEAVVSLVWDGIDMYVEQPWGVEQEQGVEARLRGTS